MGRYLIIGWIVAGLLAQQLAISKFGNTDYRTGAKFTITCVVMGPVALGIFIVTDYLDGE